MKKFTLVQFKEQYPNDDACLHKIFTLRYGNMVACPECATQAKYYRVKKRMCYECKDCGNQIYPLAGTPFHRTHLPLTYWFMVIFLQTTTRNGVAAKEIQRILGIGYKSAFRIGHKVRELMTANNPKSLKGGIVELDEFFSAGLMSNMHQVDRNKWTLRSRERQKIVLAAVQRDENGNKKVITHVVPDLKHKHIKPIIEKMIDKDATIYTDDSGNYQYLFKAFKEHQTVNHSGGEYVRGAVHTNTIEGFFSQLSRTINTHVQVSRKYMPKYTEECAWRYMNRNNQSTMFESILQNVCVV